MAAETWGRQQLDNLRTDLEKLNVAIEKGHKGQFTVDKKIEVDFFALVATVTFSENAMREFEYMAKIRNLMNEMM